MEAGLSIDIKFKVAGLFSKKVNASQIILTAIMSLFLILSSISFTDHIFETDSVYAAETIDSGIYNAAVFSPSGRFIVAGGDKKLGIKEDGKPAKTINVNDEITSIAATDEIIIAGSSKGSLTIYNMAGQVIRQFGYPEDKIKAISASQRYIAVLLGSRKLRIINLPSWNATMIDTNAAAIAFSGERLYQFGENGTLSEVEPSTGKTLNKREMGSAKKAVFSANGEYIAIARDGEALKIEIYKGADGKKVKETAYGWELLALRNDGGMVAGKGCLILDDGVKLLKPKDDLNGSGERAIAFGPDKERILIADAKNLRVLSMSSDAEEQQVIEAKEVLDAIENTQKLIREGKVEEVRFDVDPKHMLPIIRAKEWKIAGTRSPPGHHSGTDVYNTFAAAGMKEHAPFVTRSIWDLAEQLRVVDHDLVKGYVVQRPDDPNQTVLVLACKDHLDFYVLNEKKEIEWIPILLDKVGIERKPEIVIFFGENKIGKYIGTLVFDSQFTNTLKREKKGKIFIALVYPNPNEKEGKSEAAFSTLGIYEIVARR